MHYFRVVRGPNSTVVLRIPGPTNERALDPNSVFGGFGGLGFFATSALFSAGRALSCAFGPMLAAVPLEVLMRMKRVVVFLPPAAVKACDSLADRYGSNRSEVVRLAVAEGRKGAVEALERLRGLRLVEAAGADASRLWRVPATPKRPGRGRRRQVRDPDRAVSALLDYGRDARAAQPQARKADLEAALRLHALVLGVARDDVEDVVAHALAQMFGKPRVEAVADPSQPPE